MSDPDWKEAYLRHEDEEGYVPFNHDRRLGQNQYASRYARGILDTPDLGQGLRWKGIDRGDYHFIRIHKDDLETFHRRVNAYKVDASWGRAKEAEHYLDM
tara:strand:- start:2499 stop:2798 length:300 start_codon:yes stop_codon:yes gene_type:complete